MQRELLLQMIWHFVSRFQSGRLILKYLEYKSVPNLQESWRDLLPLPEHLQSGHLLLLLPDKDVILLQYIDTRLTNFTAQINSNRLDCWLCCFMQTGFGHLTCLCFFLKKLRILFGIVHLLYLCCLIKDKLFFFFCACQDFRHKKQKKKKQHPLMRLFILSRLSAGILLHRYYHSTKICVSMQGAFAIFWKLRFFLF